jgi:hypothetical protein
MLTEIAKKSKRVLSNDTAKSYCRSSKLDSIPKCRLNWRGEIYYFDKNGVPSCDSISIQRGIIDGSISISRFWWRQILD